MSAVRSRLAAIVIAFGCSLAAAGCASAPSGSEPDPAEEEKILAVIDRFFVAMREKDTSAYASVVTPDGKTYAQVLRDGRLELKSRTNAYFIERLEQGPRIVERYWDPTVLVRGPIAVVWAPYMLWSDGVKSHCGVDVFEMLRIDGEWRIGNAMWTIEPDGCGSLNPPDEGAMRPPLPR